MPVTEARAPNVYTAQYKGTTVHPCFQRLRFNHVKLLNLL